jgi:hypothetical protein
MDANPEFIDSSVHVPLLPLVIPPLRLPILASVVRLPIFGLSSCREDKETMLYIQVDCLLFLPSPATHCALVLYLMT